MWVSNMSRADWWAQELHRGAWGGAVKTENSLSKCWKLLTSIRVFVYINSRAATEWNDTRQTKLVCNDLTYKTRMKRLHPQGHISHAKNFCCREFFFLNAPLVVKLNPEFWFPQGATDSEKRVLCLSAENESLKQNLSLTQGLLQQLSTIPSQSSTMLIKVSWPAQCQ